MAHQQRTELAQQRREDKLKAETERYMNEEDPIKARKLEVCYSKHFCFVAWEKYLNDTGK